MLVSDSVVTKLLLAMTDALGWEATRHISDLTALMLDAETSRKVVENKDKILEHVPKTYRKDVAKLIDFIKENYMKTARAVATGTPHVSDIVLKYVYSNVSSDVVFDEQEAARKLAEVIPMKVTYTAGKKTLDGYVMAPTEEEKRQIIKYDGFHAGSVVRSIAHALAKVDLDEKSLTIYGKKIVLTEKGILLLAYRLGFHDMAKEYVRNMIKDIISKKLDWKIAEIKEGIGVTLHLDREWVKELMKEVIEGMPEKAYYISDARITIEPEVNLSYRLVGVIEGPHFYYELSDIYYEKDIRTDLVRDLRNFLGALVSDAAEAAMVMYDAVEIAEAEGYSVEINRWYRGASASFAKKVGLSQVTVKVFVEKTERGLNKGVWVEASIDRGNRKITKDMVASYLKRRGVEVEVDRWGRRILAGRMFETNQVREAFDFAERLGEILTDYLKDYDKKIRALKVATKMDTETYVALYLAKDVAHIHFAVEHITGRPESVLYSTVARVLKKLNPDIITELKMRANFWGDKSYLRPAYRALGYLFDYGYVTASESGNILVNGKKLKDLLLKVGFTHSLADQVETTLLDKYVSHLFDKAHISGKTPVDMLREKGLLTPDFVRALMKIARIPTLRIVLEQYRGKRIWDYLDAHDRIKLLHRSGYTGVLEVLEDKELTELYRPYADSVIRRAMYLDEALGLRAILLYNPDILGIDPEKVKLYEDRDMLAIDAGKYLIVPFKLQPTPDSEKWFLVFSKETKKSVLLNARNIPELMETLDERYRQAIEETEELKKREYDRLAQVFTQKYRDTDFELLCVNVSRDLDLKVPHSVHPLGKMVYATPGLKKTIEEFKKKLEEAREEEELVEI